GGRVGCAAARIRVGDDDRHSALRGPPGDREADDTAADDQHVCRACVTVWPELNSVGRRHRAPFAGMTRIRFCGRRLPSRPLSPVCTGLPRVDIKLSARRCMEKCVSCARLYALQPPTEPVRLAEDLMTASTERIVVVGGGLAGLRTVEELRGAGYA